MSEASGQVPYVRPCHFHEAGTRIDLHAGPILQFMARHQFSQERSCIALIGGCCSTWSKYGQGPRPLVPRLSVPRRNAGRRHARNGRRHRLGSNVGWRRRRPASRHDEVREGAPLKVVGGQRQRGNCVKVSRRAKGLMQPSTAPSATPGEFVAGRPNEA